MSFSTNYESIILHSQTTPCQPVDNQKHILIYFIPGNPGLVAYYTNYLELLHKEYSEICTSSQDIAGVHIYSASLAGFETPTTQRAVESITARLRDRYGPPPYGLLDEITFVDDAIEDAVFDLKSWLRGENGKSLNIAHENEIRNVELEVEIVLIGHSIGSYILLEVIRRGKDRLSKDKKRVGILLMPAVVDLAESTRAKQMKSLILPDWGPKVLGDVLYVMARVCYFHWVIELVVRMTGTPKGVIMSTLQLAKKPGGLQQIFRLLQTEYHIVKEDKWDDEVWGVIANERQCPVTKLFFLFAETDGWIADSVRDHLIKTRAWTDQPGHANRPIMEIDRTGIPHAFSIHHHESVVQKTIDYLQKVYP